MHASIQQRAVVETEGTDIAQSEKAQQVYSSSAFLLPQLGLCMEALIMGTTEQAVLQLYLSQLQQLVLPSSNWIDS